MGLSLEEFQRRVRERATQTIERVQRTRTIAGDIVEENLTVGGRYSPGTPVDTGEALAGWERRTQGAVETFTNDVEHIVPLEFGHSQQAPQGFMRLTALHWPQIAAEAWARAKAGDTRGGAYASPGGGA